MAARGATLQNYNGELVRCIEDLREKREEVNRSIARDEEEKGAQPTALRCRLGVSDRVLHRSIAGAACTASAHLRTASGSARVLPSSLPARSQDPE